MLDDGVHTLAYGHKEITVVAEDEEDVETPNEIVLSAEAARKRGKRVQDMPEFPEGEDPQAATAQAQVMMRFTTMRTRPSSVPNPVADRIIFFARYNGLPVPAFDGLSEHHISALKALARYELNRNTPDEQIRGTLEAIIVSLRDGEPAVGANRAAEDQSAPNVALAEYINID